MKKRKVSNIFRLKKKK